MQLSAWHYWLIFGLWLVWDGYWAWSARRVKRVASAEPWSSRLPVLALLLAVFVLIFAPFPSDSLLDKPFLPLSELTYCAGILLLLPALTLALWARRTLGRNWSGRISIKQDHELVQSGPYRWLRHPIYTGALFAVAGSALALGRVSGLIAIAVMAGIALHKIRSEERILMQHFGAAYTRYQRGTWTLLPFIW